MIGEDVVDRLFALRAAGPFQRLETAELLLIASHVRTRHYAPGRVILAAGAVADLLVVRVAGAARLGQAEAPEVSMRPVSCSASRRRPTMWRATRGWTRW